MSDLLRPALRLCTILMMVAIAAPAGAERADSTEKDTPWKVDAEHGPSSTVSFPTDEGTWISLDVHPDGDRIAFSLLGDLYLMPLSGGQARRLTHGTAYDVQPRFSPDGKWIAFASDRGGLENIWVCDLDGAQARQVSTEKKYQVNGPAWSPDGQYLLGRKRLTDRSSLGTVELWLWHLRGGDGVQITQKSDQPEASDPVFSSDGRFIYFSARDSRYRYDRDVYEGIWQIKRFDRWTGQSIPLTGEFGGAGAPMLSPDGTTLSFIRRVDARTRIELMNLATGRTRLLADGVQRDNQEGFAFHGVFPGYAWTPDGRSIVATAEGRIWRWSVATGDRTAIPFEAHVAQRVTDALRFRTDVARDRVRARVIRWPTESPDGRTLVFSTLGHLYAQRRPDGRPRRLTTGERFEYAPSFSPDGRTLAYVTWDDREGGHLWTMPAGGGRARRLTQHPAQYSNPSFSSDGKRLVFVKGSGATFRDQDPGSELWSEIHWVDARGGASHYVIGTRSGVGFARHTRPTFSPDGRRIWFLESKSNDTPGQSDESVLVSVQIDGTDRREHLKWRNASEAVVSPDGRWVVFAERHDVYVTAIPLKGDGLVDVSLSGAPLPLRKLTDTGGWWVGWTNRGRTLTWAHGAAVSRIDLEDAIPAPASGDTEEDPNGGSNGNDALPDVETVEIALEVPRAMPSGLTAYTGARLITMNGAEVIDRGTVLVRDDRIVAVGAESAVEVPPTAEVIDVYGKTVIPGLVDAHAHLHYSAQDILPSRPWKYLANLAYGVTTTHDPSATSFEVFEQGAMVEAGLLVGPRIFSTGSILYGADAQFSAVIDNLEDARRHVRRMKALGAISVKSYMQPARQQRQWVIQAAREESIMVVPEGGGDLEFDMTMILDGHTTIEHSLPVSPLYKDVVTLFGRSGTAYTPTLLVAFGGLSGDRWFFQHYDIFADKKLLRYVPRNVVEPVGRIRDVMAPDGEWHHMEVAASAKAVLDAGGRVCMGAHGQMQGIGSHWEMWAFVQGGMSPMEALRVSTLLPAESLGMDHAIGSLEPGKLADFVVLGANPLERIENSDSVERIVKNGRSYLPESLVREPALPQRR